MSRIIKAQVKEILVISLTNIGDVILTFPVIDVLKRDFPQANISIVVGPKALPLVQCNPIYKNVYCYDKKKSLLEQFNWVLALRKNYFDLVVDLRNTAIPLLLPHRYRTSLFKTKDKNVHMKDKHLNRLSRVYPFSYSLQHDSCALHVSDEDKKVADAFLEEQEIRGAKFVIVAPGAANQDKRWGIEGFADVCRFIKEKCNCSIVFVGDSNDNETVKPLMDRLNFPCANGCGKISLTQLAHLMTQSCLVFSNDSSPMHLASYLNIPVVAVFGPSNPVQYGPWSQKSAFIKKQIVCARCVNPKDIQHPHNCIDADSQDVIEKVKFFLE